MGNRIDFIRSVQGIQSPNVIVTFFDHFVALKQIVDDSGVVTVTNTMDNSIQFSIKFSSVDAKRQALNVINSSNGVLVVYGRPMTINVEDVSKREINVIIV